jgi:hypothetical protein
LTVLFLVDIENLCGGKLNYKKASAMREKLARIADGHDYLMVLGSDPTQFNLLDKVFPKEIEGRVVREGFTRSGKDGADHSIRHWVELNDSRLKDFRAVVLASGDHFFLPELQKFKKLGKKLMVVHGEGLVHPYIADFLPRRIFSVDDPRARTYVREKQKKPKALPPNVAATKSRKPTQAEQQRVLIVAPWRSAGGRAALVDEGLSFELVLCSAREKMRWVGPGILKAPWDGVLAKTIEQTDVGQRVKVTTHDGNLEVMVLSKIPFQHLGFAK